MDAHMKVIHVNIIQGDEPASKRRRRSKQQPNGIIYARNVEGDELGQDSIISRSPCQFCKKPLPESELLVHRASCRKRPAGLYMYPCEICRQPFDRRIEKENHFRECHPMTPLLVCSGCRCTFVQLDEFHSHSSYCELAQVSFVCGSCGVKFASLNGFEQHAAKAHKPKTQESNGPAGVQPTHELPGERFEEVVVLKKMGGRFVISKMSTQSFGDEMKKTNRKRLPRRERLKKSPWPYPDSPLPDLEPFLPEDFETPSPLKVVPHRRSVFRVNSVLQVSAPDVIEMLQPSGSLYMDSDYSPPSTEEFTLDEASGVLLTSDGQRLVVEPDPTDFKPFVDENAGRVYYESAYEEFLTRVDNPDDATAVPVIIGSGAETGPRRPVSPDRRSNQPETSPVPIPMRISPKTKRKQRMPMRQQDPVVEKPRPEATRDVRDHFVLLDRESEYLVQESNVYSFNTPGEEFIIPDRYPNNHQEAFRAEDQGIEATQIDEGNLCDNGDYCDTQIDTGSGELNLVKDDELPDGLQVFSDEEGRLVIVQPSGVTSVAPPGSQVVQIDTGEIFILQPTEDGNTVAVPLGGETEPSAGEAHHETTDSVAAVLNEDGSVSFLLEDSGHIHQNRTIQSV